MQQTNLCLHELFEEQARRSPRAPAVVDERGELTYEELDRQAGLLASHLRSVGIQPDEVVGVYMGRCAEYVVACLAALKAGGAYLPLELAYPPSMLEEVVADSEPRIVLTQERYVGRLSQTQTLFCMDDGWEEEVEISGSGDAARVDQENLAFVSYSSGTTGKPKGIANSHRAAVRSYLWRFGISDYGPGDRVGCNVFFIWEMLRPLLRGATTVVIPDDAIYDPGALIRFLEEYGISEILMTPSLLESVLNASGPDLGERLSDLRVLWLNGEVVTRTLARRVLGLLPETRVLNVYSCSETHEVAAGDLRELSESPHSTYCPIGHPMDPDRLYILDEEMRKVPEGDAGELFVGGDCLARGYVNLPEKTEESFPADPFSSVDGARMYRTGDKARILPDGNLEILGRTDFMVKIRGYSVELGAVETAIEKNLAVRACVVVAEGEEGEDKRLVAYLVPASEDERGERCAGWSLDPRTGRSPEIRRHLQESLPHYAIPATFVELEALPLHDVSGKVDRERLPPPPARVVPAASEPLRKLPADAPRSEKEALLARAWEDVLRLERGDVRGDDNFFDLGGHSLAAAQLSSRVEDAFGVHVSMGAFLEDPTIEGLCDRIEVLQRDGADDSEEAPLDLRAEAVLDPDIAPQAAGDPISLRDASNVFLSGATGFLGTFLLDALLRRTDARIHCLVRPRGDADPVAPIRDNLRRYGLWRPEEARRIVPVAGDLGEPLLGLSEDAFDGLAGEVDVVIHAGAMVNLVYPYAALKGVNVDGTREVLRLACLHKTKPMHHVSTNGIFPSGGHLCEEDVDLDTLSGAREDGYGRSKWVAEKLVWQAAERGLPVRVYRPGNVSGHSATGASNPRDFLGALIAESLRLGRAPEIEGWRMEMTPVDFVAGAICGIADEPDTVGGVFHLANPDPPPASEAFAWLEDMGYEIERLPYPEWLEAQREAPHREADDVIGGILHGAPSEEYEIRDDNTYDDRNTRPVLEGSGLRRPEIGPDLLENYARYFAEQGWIGAPPALSGGRRTST
jgi:amino acid adenylation domain-containing protein/thioester reductase-like protein